MAKKNNKKEKQLPQVNRDLNGFDVMIDEFGEIKSTFNISKLNSFLDENTDDKKFRGVEVLRKLPDDDKNPEEASWG
jgi:hypothetical protein